MPAIIFHDPLKGSKLIKNLGWLIKNATEINKIIVTELKGATYTPKTFGEVYLYAYFPDKVFVTPFESKQVCRDWLKRSRSLRGIEVEFCGETFLTGHK